MGSMGGSSGYNVKKIAIIGAGPAGTAAAKYFLAEKAFDKIDIFEQRSTFGGLWQLNPVDPEDNSLAIPQTSPFAPNEEPTWEESNSKDIFRPEMRRKATFSSPLYDRLETNIPKQLMQYSDKPFPDETQLFPRHETVTRYLEEYSDEIRHLVRFETQVLDVRRQREGWLVKSRNLLSSDRSEDRYDAVAVASGHYSIPFIPDIRGMREFNKAHPGVLSHSKFYRLPEQYHNKKVVIVGNSSSGLDIGAQIQPYARKPLLISKKSESYLSPGGPRPGTDELPQIEEFLPAKRGMRFTDGHVEEGVDAVLFCTGYFYSFPFLSSLDPAVITNGTRTEHLYKHMLYIPDPTLAFLVLTQQTIPFPLSESQSAVIARVWSKRLSLPCGSEMASWERSELEKKTRAGKRFHALMFPLDKDYINELHVWSMQADRRPGLDNHGVGKEPPSWGEKEAWARERFPAIKKAFAELGPKRTTVRTMEELGFDFEAWKREKATESGRAEMDEEKEETQGP